MLFAQNKEVMSLREDHEQLMEMRTEVQHLHAIEQTYKLSTDRITELELIIAQLTEDLDKERLEKESAANEKELIKKESELVGKVFASIFVVVYECECMCLNWLKLNVFFDDKNS